MLVTLSLSPKPRHLMLHLSVFGGAVTHLVAAFPVVLFSVHAVDECVALAQSESPPRDSRQGMGLISEISQGNRNPSQGRSAGSHWGS